MFVKNIIPGVGLQVFGSYHSEPNASGVMMWDNSVKQMKVVDVAAYATPTGIPCNTPTISLAPEAIAVIQWATKRMEEEAELNRLCETHPGLKDAKTAFEVMKILCKS